METKWYHLRIPVRLFEIMRRESLEGPDISFSQIAQRYLVKGLTPAGRAEFAEYYRQEEEEKKAKETHFDDNTAR